MRVRDENRKWIKRAEKYMGKSIHSRSEISMNSVSPGVLSIDRHGNLGKAVDAMGLPLTQREKQEREARLLAQALGREYVPDEPLTREQMNLPRHENNGRKSSSKKFDKKPYMSTSRLLKEVDEMVNDIKSGSRSTSVSPSPARLNTVASSSLDPPTKTTAGSNISEILKNKRKSSVTSRSPGPSQSAPLTVSLSNSLKGRVRYHDVARPYSNNDVERRLELCQERVKDVTRAYLETKMVLSDERGRLFSQKPGELGDELARKTVNNTTTSVTLPLASASSQALRRTSCSTSPRDRPMLLETKNTRDRSGSIAATYGVDNITAGANSSSLSKSAKDLLAATDYSSDLTGTLRRSVSSPSRIDLDKVTPAPKATRSSRKRPKNPSKGGAFGASLRSSSLSPRTAGSSRASMGSGLLPRSAAAVQQRRKEQRAAQSGPGWRTNGNVGKGDTVWDCVKKDGIKSGRRRSSSVPPLSPSPSKIISGGHVIRNSSLGERSSVKELKKI